MSDIKDIIKDLDDDYFTSYILDKYYEGVLTEEQVREILTDRKINDNTIS